MQGKDGVLGEYQGLRVQGLGPRGDGGKELLCPPAARPGPSLLPRRKSPRKRPGGPEPCLYGADHSAEQVDQTAVPRRVQDGALETMQTKLTRHKGPERQRSSPKPHRTQDSKRPANVLSFSRSLNTGL